MKSNLRTCKHCKADLSMAHPNTRYCGDPCYRLWKSETSKSEPIETDCKLCDKTFTASGKGMTFMYYCSGDCHYTSGIIRQYGDPKEIYKIWSSVKSCQICNEEFQITRNKCVDHCHTTGKVRGILCSRCNSGIGYLQESPVIMTSAIDYVRKHNAN